MSNTSPNPSNYERPEESGRPPQEGLLPTPSAAAEAPVPVPQAAAPAPSYPTPAPMQATGSRGMYTAAAVINWVTLGIVVVATFGIGIIAAAWFIPMTIMIHKGAKGPYKHTALGVCTLLFCNIISGILMLVDDSNRPPKPVA